MKNNKRLSINDVMHSHTGVRLRIGSVSQQKIICFYFPALSNNSFRGFLITKINLYIKEFKKISYFRFCIFKRYFLCTLYKSEQYKIKKHSIIFNLNILSKEIMLEISKEIFLQLCTSFRIVIWIVLIWLNSSKLYSYFI